MKDGRKRLVFAIHGSDKPFAGVLPANCWELDKTLRNPILFYNIFLQIIFCSSPACWREYGCAVFPFDGELLLALERL